MLREFCILDTEVVEGVAPVPAICYRAAAIGTIGTANFALLTMAQADVRAQARFPEEEESESGVDGYNALFAKKQEKKVQQQMQKDQGGTNRMSNRERGALMNRIIFKLNEDLLTYADSTKVEHPRTGEELIIPEPYHIGQTLSLALENMITRQPTPANASTRALADALGVTEEEMRASQLRGAAFQANFLKNNKALVLEMAMGYNFETMIRNEKLTPEERKGRLESLYKLELDSLFDRLPAIDRLRLLVAADNGLLFRRKTAAERYLADSRQEELLSDVGHYDASRKLLHIRINDFCKEPAIMRELTQAKERGDRIPNMKPLIVPIKREKEAEKKTA